MKKCLIFFTLLLITIGIAVITQEKESLVVVSDVAMGETTAEDLLPEEKSLVIDQ